MAHNINTYIGRQAAWHNLGIVTGKFMSSAELLANEGFQYHVFKAQLQDGLGRKVDAWGTFRWNHVDKVADKKDAATFLATVGRDYTVIPHAKGFEQVDQLVQSVNGAHYETAGVLGKGEKVWALASLNQSIRVGDDETKLYLMFTTSHDGTVGYQYKLVAERVVCENTLQLALNEKSKASLSVRHTKNAKDRLAAIGKALEGMSEQALSVEQKLNFLANRRMNREALTKIMDRLFPKRVDAETGETKETTRRDNVISEILSIYEVNDGNAFPEQRGTAYNLLNAITNYVDHSRGSDDSRAESAMFGSGDAFKAKALDLIMAASEKLDTVGLVRGTKQYSDQSVSLEGSGLAIRN